MKKTILIITLFVIGFNLNAQNTEDNSYYPLIKGQSKTLTWYKGFYREVIKDTIKLNGKCYTQVSQIFPRNNSIDIFLRKSNDTIYFYNEEAKKEKPFFGINPKKGEKIGNGKIKKVNGKLKTPKGKYNDLLVIEMKYSNGSKDIRYFKKGLGLIAVKDEKGLISYYVPGDKITLHNKS